VDRAVGHPRLVGYILRFAARGAITGGRSPVRVWKVLAVSFEVLSG
jgi:hypothetical protein